VGKKMMAPFAGNCNDIAMEANIAALVAQGSSAGFSQIQCNAMSAPESSRGEATGNPSFGETVTSTLPDKPLRVSDLDQTQQAASWIKKPLYYTHHRKDDHEQLSQGASWNCIADNAFQASMKFPGKHCTMVVLLYCVSCNPFHLGDVDVLKRARASLETLSFVFVVGTLVVPSSDSVLRERGIAEERRLPFTLRRDLARKVLKGAQQDSWVVVDTCRGTAEDQARSEGCMQNVLGSIAPLVSVYARGRLHSKQFDIRVLEVRSEDPIEGFRTGEPMDQLHVSPSKVATCPSYGPGGMRPGLAAIGTLVVDVPKQSQCDDLIWCAVKQPQDRQCFLAMERFCGTGGAQMIADWVNKKNLTKRRKTKLLGN
jgi:hypothetical protein